MVKLDFKPWYYPLVVIIFIAGYLGATFFDIYFNWLSMLAAGILNLVILYGFSKIKLFFRPLPSPKLRILLKYVLLSFILELVVIVFIVLFSQKSLSSAHNTVLIPSAQGIHYPPLLRIWVTFTVVTSIIGEEVSLASVLIPPIHLLLQTRFKRFAWPIVNILGCILFGLLHLPHYNFNWAFPLIVAITRYPVTASWRETNTLRSGIYLHWISDITVIIGNLF